MGAETRLEVRRGVFRQAVASLGIAASGGGPSPLEGVDRDRLLAAVRVARADGLLADADWLSNPATAAALYELSGELPAGEDRIEVARLVLAEVYRGGAATFAAVATRMARGSARGLAGAGIRARVALCLFLPLSTEIAADDLALALVSRRDLSRHWVDAHAVGSLPQRRLAARLLERAARRAAALARSEPGALVLPIDEGTRSAWRTLLEDRETLVWRHAASARGLLVDVQDGVGDEIERQLSSELSPTEWRRAATSLVASMAIRPDAALARAHSILRGSLPERDPGVLGAMVWGLAAAADVEPDAAEELLDALAEKSPIAIAESLIDLLADVPGFGPSATRRSAEALLEGAGASDEDPSLGALARTISADLARESAAASGHGDAPVEELRHRVRQALLAYGQHSAIDAHAKACEALEIARRAVDDLESSDVHARAIPLVRELDHTLFESSDLAHLLLLPNRGTAQVSAVTALDALEERLARWLLVRATAGTSGPSQGMRELKALLHAVDGERADRADDPAFRAVAVARWTATASALTSRLSKDASSPLRRAMAATVGRAFDGLVRDGAADVADVFLFSATATADPTVVGILAEASRHPDLRAVLSPLARFMSARSGRREALTALVQALPTGASARLDLVHGSLSRLAAALACIEAAEALSALIPASQSAGASPIDVVEEEVDVLAHLVMGASQRCAGSAEPPAATPRAPRAAAPSVALRRLLGREHDDRDMLRDAVAAWVGQLLELPLGPFGEASAQVMTTLSTLPMSRPATKSSLLPPSHALPTWLPQRRTLGGFYVKRPLGRGAVGTVFAVVRAEDRGEPDAPEFALKVPDYDERAARSLSEAQFSRMFREEAGALLAVPEHPNLAGFVTFDAGCRPKPILVMELVEGVGCDVVLESRTLTVRQALGVLYGIASGLEAMHGVGIAHLDVKPSNVILRSSGAPVLVDFGLSGRRLRPGCGTGSYGAPEVWSSDEGAEQSPMPADVYAMGCLAYELLTAETLFSAANDLEVIAAHFSHDGMPDAVRRLSQRPATEQLGMLLFNCLRRDPKDRITVGALRAELDALAPTLSDASWPIATGRGDDHG